MRKVVIYLFLLLLTTATVIKAQDSYEIQYLISTQSGAHILMESKKWYDDYFISQLATWTMNSVHDLSDDKFRNALEDAVASGETMQMAFNRSNYKMPPGIRFAVFKARNSGIYIRTLPHLGAALTDGRKDTIYDESIDLILVRDSLINFNWSIEDEYKWIDSIRCRKAVMTFRCNDYVAWYDPATAVPAGPEQFGGLPGLIMAMSRSGDGRSWYLKKFSLISESDKVKMDVIRSKITQNASVDWCEYGQILHRYSEHISKKFGSEDCKTCKSKFKIIYYECFEECLE